MADTLTITDNRTGKQYEIPIQDGTIKAMDLRQIKVAPDDFGMMTYDPAFTNTAACRSRVTYIDGDKGILMYRGYPIEQLAEHSTYLETAYLVLFGELPSRSQLEQWTRNVGKHMVVPEGIRRSSKGSATTRTRWECSSAPSGRSAPSARTPRRSATPRYGIGTRST
jgi:citrate synthase